MTTNINIVRDKNGKVVAGKVTKTFCKKANIFGTSEYDIWEQFITKNPKAKMVVIKTAKTKRIPIEEKKIRPTYEKMINFINSIYKNNNESIETHIKEMNRIKNMAAINGNSYNMVVKWFNNTFEEMPEYKEVFRCILSENSVDEKAANV